MNPSPVTGATANQLDGQSQASDRMKIDCELRLGSSHLQEGSKMTVDDTDVAVAEKEKTSPTFAATRNATAADGTDMVRQEELGQFKPPNDAVLEATIRQRFFRRSLPRKDGFHHIVYSGVSARRRSTYKPGLHRPAASKTG